MARRPQPGNGSQEEIDAQIRDVTKLVQATLNEMSATDLKGGGGGPAAMRFNCKGTFGSFGTATGCLGTFGTFGCGQRQIAPGGTKAGRRRG
jgi:hypothetical protein